MFGSPYGYIDRLPPSTLTAQLYHGIGMKSDVYSPGLGSYDVRFVEGPHYARELRERFPGTELAEVGYAKVDPLFWPEHRRTSHFDVEAAGLDPRKPTVLYAPTHAPSSFPLMPDDLPRRFTDCNLVVKPHFLSFFGVKRKSHRRKMELWAKAPNCYVASADEYDPVPFMVASDLLVSEASSVLFEFAATGKPVVWCDFFQVHWGRRGPFRYRMRRRMDPTIDRYRGIGAHARRPRDVPGVVRDELETPERYAEPRRRATRELIGPTDGKVSERIVDYLVRTALSRSSSEGGRPSAGFLGLGKRA